MQCTQVNLQKRTHTSAFIAPAFLWCWKPGLFSRETYTSRGNSLPSVSRPPLCPKNTWIPWKASLIHKIQIKLTLFSNGRRIEVKSTWIMPGWSLGLFPGQAVPSAMVHPSSGTFWALATSALIRILNSSYSLWNKAYPKVNIQAEFGERAI